MQSTCSLEDKVREFLLKEHDLIYNSKLTYKQSDTTHILEWELNDQNHPYVMMGDFETEDDFFQYVCKTINATRFFLRKYCVAKMRDKI